MRSRIIPTIVAVATMGFVAVSFQNCGQQGFLDQGDMSSQASQSDPKTLFDLRNDMKTLTSEQVFSSMAALTGVSLDNQQAQNDWRNNRTNTLADNFSVFAITAPLLLNTTNLAGIFCDEALKIETVANATRRLFVGVNFAGQVSALDGAAYSSFIENMSQMLWGRNLSGGEQTMLLQARTDHVAAIAANQRTNVAETRRLALMVCTAMLSSNDAFTF